MLRPRPGFSAALLLATLLCGCEKSDARFAKRARLPTGRLDLPSTPVVRAAPGSSVVLAGWALADDGIAEVNVYSDGRLLRSSGARLPRPDVAKAFPLMKGSARAGFHLVVDPSETGPGAHELVLQARTNRGAVGELGRFTLIATTAR